MKPFVVGQSVFASFLLTSTVSAQFVVQDPAVLAQMLIEYARKGDPGAIRDLAGLEQVRKSLGLPGLGETLERLQQVANGTNTFSYDGGGLYRVIQDRVITAAGKEVLRQAQDYRKFDAIAQTASNFKAVQKDVESRRRELRELIRALTSQLQSAITEAEVQKIQALMASHSAELATLDRERDAALARVIVQDIENKTDEKRQQTARVEDRAATFQSANEKLSKFLRPNSSASLIPTPNTPRP